MTSIECALGSGTSGLPGAPGLSDKKNGVLGINPDCLEYVKLTLDAHYHESLIVIDSSKIFRYLPYFDLAVNGMHDSLGLLGPTLFSATTLNSYLSPSRRSVISILLVVGFCLYGSQCIPDKLGTN